MAESQRRSTRLAALPKKEEVSKPAAKPRKPTNKRPAADEAKDVEPEEKPAKKSKAAAKEAPEAEEEEAKPDETTEELKSIDIGDSLPSLTLKNEKDEDLDVSTITAEKGVVLFLVPKADTPGCTTQACGFRDIYPDFTGSGFDVYCLSADSPTAQAKWQTKKELPYPLISDPKRKLIKALGAASGSKTLRSHFIFEKGGKLVDKKNPVKPADSPKSALEFIKGLTA
ncbi:AhpC-TSA-domain-containing protein [Trametopsis cervina]|nr:AhpC-TSA-domain-containing protein [Trametopsis cervina]